MAYRLSIVDRLDGGGGGGRRAPAPAAAAAMAAGSSGDGGCQQQQAGVNGLSVEHHWLALASSFNGRVQRPHLYAHRLPPPQSCGAAASGGTMRIVLGDPPEANARLRNRKQIAAACAGAPGGCLLLLRRGGGSSFAEKAWRALQACPDVAAIVVGNDDRAHPHALFAMPGAWPPPPAPTPTAAASAAAAATARQPARPTPKEAPPVPVVMISYAAYEQVLGLLRLEAEDLLLHDAGGGGRWLPFAPSFSSAFSAAAGAGHAPRLHVRLEPLLQPILHQPQQQLPRPPRPLLRLSSFEVGAAVRQAVRANDYALLRALLDEMADDERDEDEEQDGTAGAPPPPTYTEAEAHTGQTVLHLAVEADATECLTQLLQRPGIARVLDAPNGRGRRPIHVAAALPGRGLALRLLLAAGAYVDAPDRHLGWTALHFAAAAGACEAVEALAQAGAALDYRGLDGSTPFILSVHCGRAAAAEALLAAGANPSLPNLRGKRPADCAVGAAGRGLQGGGGGGGGGDSGNECARLLARYEQQDEGAGGCGRADCFHWSAAPWLAVVGRGEPAAGAEAVAAGVRVVCFDAGGALPCLDGVGEARDGRCRAILPSALLRASLRAEAERWHNSGGADSIPSTEKGAEEKEDEAAAIRLHLHALGQTALNPNAAAVRAIARAARAAWVAGVPALGARGRLALVELPVRRRRALWLGALTGRTGTEEEGAEEEGRGSVVGPDAVEEGWLCQGSPVRSPAIGARVRCLFEDLRRTRVPAYCSGPGMDRVRRLVLLWLRSDEANDYRQGLTFVACPILEAFQPAGWQERPAAVQKWDPVSDGQALLCLRRALELHSGGLYVHGNSLDTLQRRIGLVESLLMYHDPALAAHLAGCRVAGALYLSRWLITLFSDCLPLPHTSALWDALFTLGRGALPCLAAAAVLQHRDSLLATPTQTNLLLFFSQLNSGADNNDDDGGGHTISDRGPRIDLSACLTRALAIYATTPGALFRAWDDDDLARRRRTTSDADSGCLPPLVEPPVVLERPLEVTARDLAELVAAGIMGDGDGHGDQGRAQAAAVAPAGPTAAGGGGEGEGEGLVSSLASLTLGGCDEPARRRGALLLDVRDLSLEDHYSEFESGGASGNGAGVLLLPPGCPRLRLPWTRIRGHVGFCKGLAAVQQEMQPPRVLRPYVGNAHVVVYAGRGRGAQARARAVARMLVLCRVPFVSVYVPGPSPPSSLLGVVGGGGDWGR